MITHCQQNSHLQQGNRTKIYDVIFRVFYNTSPPVRLKISDFSSSFPPLQKLERGWRA